MIRRRLKIKRSLAIRGSSTIGRKSLAIKSTFSPGVRRMKEKIRTSESESSTRGSYVLPRLPVQLFLSSSLRIHFFCSHLNSLQIVLNLVPARADYQLKALALPWRDMVPIDSLVSVVLRRLVSYFRLSRIRSISSF